LPIPPYFQPFHLAGTVHDAVSIPANPVPEDVVSGTIKTRMAPELRFARWAPPAGRKGTVCVFAAAARPIENISRPCATCGARFCGGDDRLARQGHSSRRLRDPRKGYVRDFSDYVVDVEAFVQQVVTAGLSTALFALRIRGRWVMLRWRMRQALVDRMCCRRR